ncbi:ChaN family lipoprotein [Meridianimarinicoccus aquatilis]|uniref:ChaN family lipoprotein n=1 Tax=Meridianimarinicoccus aquatilis TaxID=2552766 RepID=UPI001AA060DF|nr:ChaN family lipoprotein [Fluviibacterium aquatile]
MAALICWAAAVPAAARQITEEALTLLPPVDVVILGEVHDNPRHHLNQALALRAIEPAAVVFEMLSPEQAAIANRRTRVGEALGLALKWVDGGWPPFSMYLPVFDAAGLAQIYGMAVPRGDVTEAFKTGPASVFGPDAGRYGLDQALGGQEQADREQMQLEAHCNALPTEMLAGMVNAQRLRDASFARTILQAIADVGGPVAVITGSGHARNDWGIPAALRKAAPQLRVLSVGQLEDHGELPSDPPFDLWLATQPAPRPDPCAGFAGGGGQNG